MSDDKKATCELCGEPMPPGEEMFYFHGYSGPCPKPPLPKPDTEAASAIPTRAANPNGLYRRYIVTKLDEPTDPLATYFVLRIDSHGRDQAHIAACRAAARAYADAVTAGDTPHLAQVGVELRRLVDNLESAGA